MARITHILAAWFVLHAATLLLAAPTQALAQEPAQDAAQSSEGVSTELASPAPASLTLRLPSRPALWRATLAGGAVATGVAVGATHLGLLAAARRCEGNGGLDDWFGCANTGVVAFITMNALAYPAVIAGGVTLGGHLAGGHGRYDMTLVGSTFGSGLGWLLMMAMSRADSDAGFTAALGALPLLQLAGSLAGYHLSHRRRAGRERQFGPTLTPMRQGAVAGLVGRF
jgi:hypothetical protein